MPVKKSGLSSIPYFIELLLKIKFQSKLEAIKKIINFLIMSLYFYIILCKI
jgi:hypothetical protein